MADLVAGVDGGNSKTDLILADTDGRLLAWVRGEGTRPHTEGMAVTTERLAALLRRALAEARWGDASVEVKGDRSEVPVTSGEVGGLRGGVAVGAYFLANVDTADDESEALRRLSVLDVAARVIVGNDTLAILRAGSVEGWGVAVVSGAGINAAGVHPDGGSARFLSLGEITGDWGGGMSVARAGLGAAVRAGDGRGPVTVLREVLPVRFGLASVEAVALAVGRGEIPVAALHRLAPVVFAAAEDGDPVAREIVLRLGEEIVTMVTALLRRLDLLTRPTPVVLGGGTLQNGHALLQDHIRARLAERAPLARPRVLDVPPVAGAVAEAMAEAGASEAARRRLRAAIAATEPPGDTR
jgi:N-acetylglucosamine kinase-like BadF-type ATPase